MRSAQVIPQAACTVEQLLVGRHRVLEQIGQKIALQPQARLDHGGLFGELDGQHRGGAIGDLVIEVDEVVGRSEDGQVALDGATQRQRSKRHRQRLVGQRADDDQPFGHIAQNALPVAAADVGQSFRGALTTTRLDCGLEVLVEEIHGLTGDFGDDVRDQLEAAVFDQRRQQPFVHVLHPLRDGAVAVDQHADDGLFEVGQWRLDGHAQHGTADLVGLGHDFTGDRFRRDERDHPGLGHVADHARHRTRLAHQLQGGRRQQPDLAMVDAAEAGRPGAQQTGPGHGIAEPTRARHHAGAGRQGQSQDFRHSD